MYFTGPSLAVLLYGILSAVTLTRVLNHLPGVFALRRPMGVVRSGYEYLWAPAIVAALARVSYTGAIEGRADRASRYWTANYGAYNDSVFPLAALGVFALLMWSLKLRATMEEANRELGPGPATS